MKNNESNPALKEIRFQRAEREMKHFSSFLVCLFFMTCNKGPITAPDQQLPKLDEPFEVKVGQSVLIISEQLTFQFESVPDDSRCPEGVMCFWAGNAGVVLRFSDTRDTLNTYLDPHEIGYNAYSIKLLSLSPYPKYPHVIPRDSYVAKLVVSKK